MFDVPFYIAEEYLYNNRVYKGKYPISIIETACETDEIFKAETTVIEELDEDEIFKYDVKDLSTGSFLPFQTQDLNKQKYADLEKQQQKKYLNLYENPQKRYNDYNEIKEKFSEKQKEQRIYEKEKIKARPADKKPEERNKIQSQIIETAKKVEVAEKTANKNIKKEKQKKKKERERQIKLAKKR